MILILAVVGLRVPSSIWTPHAVVAWVWLLDVPAYYVLKTLQLVCALASSASGTATRPNRARTKPQCFIPF